MGPDTPEDDDDTAAPLSPTQAVEADEAVDIAEGEHRDEFGHDL